MEAESNWTPVANVNWSELGESKVDMIDIDGEILFYMPAHIMFETMNKLGSTGKLVGVRPTVIDMKSGLPITPSMSR